MELMTGGDFPFPVVGMVHLRNRIQQRRRIGADAVLDLRVWTEDLRPHDKGSQFEIRAEAATGGEPVWESWSTYLYRHGNGGGAGQRSPERAEPPQPEAQWEIPGDAGRSYAGVSGDSNPIHMHSLSARLFGMPGAIAHGMWLKARCLAALEDQVPDALEAEVGFKLPLRIPATVSFASWPDGDGRGFALHDGKNEKPHLTGSVRPLRDCTPADGGLGSCRGSRIGSWTVERDGTAHGADALAKAAAPGRELNEAECEVVDAFYEAGRRGSTRTTLRPSTRP